MPRLAFSQQGRTRATRKRDLVAVALKAATFVAGLGVLAMIVLLAGTDELDSADAPPTEQATTPGALRAEAPKFRPPLATSATTEVPAPTSETSAIEASPPPTEPPPEPTTEQPPAEPEFAVIGEPCTEPGTYSLTSEYRPVMCHPDARTQEPVWQPIY